VGHVVKCAGKPVGALCAVYTTNFQPTEEDRRLLALIASAIGNEDTRKQAMEALRQSEEEKDTILSAIQAGIIIVDEQTHDIIDINDAALKLIGRPKPNVIGACCHKFICPAEKGQCPVTDLHTIVNNSERVLLDVLGNRVPILKTVVPITLHGRRCLLECFLDLTERKRAEEQLKRAQSELINASRLAGMGEVATSVLHNVGNVLNSINVSTQLVADQLRLSKATNLARVSAMLREHAADMGDYLTRDPKGKQLPEYINQLAGHLDGERKALLREMETIRNNIQHIKEIVAVQQNYAQISGVSEVAKVADLVEDALRMNVTALQRHDVHVVRQYDSDVPDIIVEKHRVLQVLVNVIRNAKQACSAAGRTDKRLTVRISRADERVRITLTDNGVGISSENLKKVFTHGFTTRKDGHGFGLHSGALAAQEMGGSLNVHSDGLGCGAAFTLELPLQPPSRQKQALPMPSSAPDSCGAR
jgi:PAS domain S-box-containing protein